MDKIMKFLEDFSPDALLPDLSTMLGKVELLMRVLILVGPLVVLVFGLCYLFLPPKEANHSFGYRFFWGMSSVAAWRFTQKLAGMVWTAVGALLSIIMLFFCMRLPGMETMDMVWTVVKCVLWELGVVAVACLGIDVTLIVLFDRKGVRRTRRPAPEKKNA